MSTASIIRDLTQRLSVATSTSSFRFATITVAVIYLILVSAYLVTHGAWPTPGFLIPPLVLIAIVYGRGWSFVSKGSPERGRKCRGI